MVGSLRTTPRRFVLVLRDDGHLISIDPYIFDSIIASVGAFDQVTHHVVEVVRIQRIAASIFQFCSDATVSRNHVADEAHAPTAEGFPKVAYREVDLVLILTTPVIASPIVVPNLSPLVSRPGSEIKRDSADLDSGVRDVTRQVTVVVERRRAAVIAVLELVVRITEVIVHPPVVIVVVTAAEPTVVTCDDVRTPSFATDCAVLTDLRSRPVTVVIPLTIRSGIADRAVVNASASTLTRVALAKAAVRAGRLAIAVARRVLVSISDGTRITSVA